MKKKFVFGLIAAIMVFALAGLASAAANLNAPINITLGSTTSQERNISISANFNLANNGDVNITNITITSLNVDSKYNVMFSWDNSVFSNSINITEFAVNDSKTIYVKGIIPLSEASGTNVNIGSVKISNNTISKMITIYINPSTFAASLNVQSSVTIGSSEEERNKTINTNFDITNNGNIDLSNLIVTSNIDSKYNVSFSLDDNAFNKNVTINLPAGTYKKVYVKGIIPLDQASGTNVDIGDITISNSQITHIISNVYINPVSKLEIRNVKFIYGDETDTAGSKGGEAKFDYKGSKTLEIKFDAKNTFPSGDNIEISDPDYEITIEDIDAGDDASESISGKDISDKKTESEAFSFSELKPGNHRVWIRGSGRDDTYNALHTYEWYGSVNFEKDEHNVRIQSASVNPSVLKCSNSATVIVTVENIGEEEEDHAVVTVNSSTLGISIGEAFELSNEEDSTSSKHTSTFPISIPPNLAPGVYILGVNAYASEEVFWNYKALELIVQACDGSMGTTPPPTTTTPNNTIIQYITQPAANQGQIIGQPVEASASSDSIVTIALLALGALIVMIIIIVLLVKLVK